MTRRNHNSDSPVSIGAVIVLLASLSVIAAGCRTQYIQCSFMDAHDGGTIERARQASAMYGSELDTDSGKVVTPVTELLRGVSAAVSGNDSQANREGDVEGNPAGPPLPTPPAEADDPKASQPAQGIPSGER